MTDCFWDRLASDRRPVWLYGTGNGADKILDIASSRGIRVTGVFASDGFVRDRSFRGMPVRSYADVLRSCGDDIVILLGFGSDRPEVTAFLRLLDERHELIIPEVPLCGGELFDGAYAEEHREEMARARSLLADERSRALFDDAVRFRLTGRLSLLSDTESFSESCASLLGGRVIGCAVDGGAYRGDTAAAMADTLRPDRILAVEPDPGSYNKLVRWAQTEGRDEVTAIRAALWDEDGTTVLACSGNRGAGANGRSRRAKESVCPAVTMDTLLKDERADFIKLDTEGTEMRVLRGGRAVLKRDAPNLAVSVYHRTDDLWRLSLEVHALLPTHRLCLRRVPCVPMWDLTLWALRPD